MDRTGYSYMGLTQANTSKQDESRSLAAVPMVDPPELSEFVYAPIGSQNNGMTLSVHSALP